MMLRWITTARGYASFFLAKVIFAFFADCLGLFIFSFNLTLFLLMLFVWKALEEEINWPHLNLVIGGLLFEGFMMSHPFGLPLFYLIPGIWLARQIRSVMHFSRAFYPLFLWLLMLCDAGIMGQGISVAGVWSSSTVLRICGNIVLMTVFSLK